MIESTTGLSASTPPSELLQRIEELRATVRHLRGRVEELEGNREALLQENRSLRRTVTHAQLADGVLTGRAGEEDAEGGEAATEDAAIRAGLYRALPVSCAFHTFFQVADQRGLDTAAARQALRHFLDEGRLAREGTRLRKPEARS